MFPKDVARRRAFLKSLGASTALAALSQFFPLETATEVFGSVVRWKKTDLKVGFIPITCATPIIMAHPMGFYSKQGLNVEVDQDRRLGGDPRQDASTRNTTQRICCRRCRWPSPLGVGSNPVPYTVPAIENINGAGDHAVAIKLKDKRDPKSWKAASSPFRSTISDAQLSAALLRGGSMASIRTQDIQIRAVPPPEMVANLRADNIDGFLGPDPMNQRAVYDGVGFIHHAVEGNLGPPSVLRVRRIERTHHGDSNT